MFLYMLLSLKLNSIQALFLNNFLQYFNVFIEVFLALYKIPFLKV